MRSPSHAEPKFSVQGDWWGCHPPGSRLGLPASTQVLGDGGGAPSPRAGRAPRAAWEGPGHVGSPGLPSEGRPVYPFVSGPESQGAAPAPAGSLVLGFWDLVPPALTAWVGACLAPHGFWVSSPPPATGSQGSPGPLHASLTRFVKWAQRRTRYPLARPLFLPYLQHDVSAMQGLRRPRPELGSRQFLETGKRIWRRKRLEPCSCTGGPSSRLLGHTRLVPPLGPCSAGCSASTPSLPCPSAPPGLLARHPPPQLC